MGTTHSWRHTNLLRHTTTQRMPNHAVATGALDIEQPGASRLNEHRAVTSVSGRRAGQGAGGSERSRLTRCPAARGLTVDCCGGPPGGGPPGGPGGGRIGG